MWPVASMPATIPSTIAAWAARRPSPSRTGGGADRLGEAVRDTDQEPYLDRQPDLRLVVLKGVAARVVELGAAHIGVAIDEDALPRHLDVLEPNERIVLVEARGERIVGLRRRGRLVGFARQDLEARRRHRNGEGEGEVFLARPQRLQVGAQQLGG